MVVGCLAAVGSTGVDAGGKHPWHLAVVEEPYRSFFDRLTASGRHRWMFFLCCFSGIPKNIRTFAVDLFTTGVLDNPL